MIEINHSLIRRLNDVLSARHISDMHLRIIQNGYGIYRIHGDSLSETTERHGTDCYPIHSALWFDNFWIYLQISQEVGVSFKFSMSVFYGLQDSAIKKKIFRADFDDYVGSDSYSHPQPHWHFTWNEEEYYSSIEQLNDSNFYFVEQDNQSEIDIILGTNSLKNINLSAFHFSMISNSNKLFAMNSITDVDTFCLWFSWLMDFVKSELTYVLGKSR